jgi:hypothetical protein
VSGRIVERVIVLDCRWRDQVTRRTRARLSRFPKHLTTTRASPRETVAQWLELVGVMGPYELADFEERTFRQWDRAKLVAGAARSIYAAASPRDEYPRVTLTVIAVPMSRSSRIVIVRLIA